jgi:hypothetical protein
MSGGLGCVERIATFMPFPLAVWRIYFGTDYDNQRNRKVLKIASDNNM